MMSRLCQNNMPGAPLTPNSREHLIKAKQGRKTILGVGLSLLLISALSVANYARTHSQDHLHIATNEVNDRTDKNDRTNKNNHPDENSRRIDQNESKDQRIISNAVVFPNGLPPAAGLSPAPLTYPLVELPPGIPGRTANVSRRRPATNAKPVSLNPLPVPIPVPRARSAEAKRRRAPDRLVSRPVIFAPTVIPQSGRVNNATSGFQQLPKAKKTTQAVRRKQPRSLSRRSSSSYRYNKTSNTQSAYRPGSYYGVNPRTVALYDAPAAHPELAQPREQKFSKVIHVISSPVRFLTAPFKKREHGL